MTPLAPPVRVALVGSGVLPIPPPGWGAVERAIDGLARGLRSLGADVTVVNRDGHGRPRDEYGFALRLGSYLGKGPWDVVHASTPVVANRLAFSGRPYVYTSHSRHWFGTSGVSQRWGYWLERRATARAARAIALTPDVARRIAEEVGPSVAGRTRVVPNGIDASRFKPNWAARTGHEILGVGAVHRRKRWDVAVRVVAGVEGARLTIVGPVQDPAYADELRHLLGPDRLVLAGEVPDAALAQRYAASDVFLLSSTSELMSIAVMEAMAAGLPVVGTRAIASLVTEGTTGLTVDAGLPDQALASALRGPVSRLVSDPGLARRMGEAGRSHALAHWDWPAVARQVLDVYGEVAGA